MNYLLKLRELKNEEWLDCGDNSCTFLMKPRTGMRTNGGCRCFKYTDIPHEKLQVIRRYHEIAKSLDLWLELAEAVGGEIELAGSIPARSAMDEESYISFRDLMIKQRYKIVNALAKLKGEA